MKSIKIIFVTVISLLASCDRPECKNTNPILLRYQPSEPEYKAELAKQLAAMPTADLTFWIRKCIDTGDKTWMSINIQGNNLFAEGLLDITEDKHKRLAHYKEVKGVGYTGAELKGLHYTVDSANGSYNLKFVDVLSIAD